MQQLLIIDTDNVRRRELCQLSEGLDLEILAIDNYEAALKWLRPGSRERLQAVILTWPRDTSRQADELLGWLAEPAQNTLPLLILADDAPPAALAWASSRANTAFLDWTDRQRLAPSLDLLLQSPSGNMEPDLNTLSATVLLVDDSPTARLRFRHLLQQAGYAVEAVGSPNEALEKALHTPFDLAILDYFMPETNGADLCAMLQQLPVEQQPLCAILTSSYMDKVIRESLDAGAVDCLFKNEADALFLARVNSMARDVHLHRRIEKKQRQLQSILASVGDGVYGVDCNGVITYVNPAVSRLLGYSEQELLSGVTARELFHLHAPGHTPDPDRCALAPTIDHGQPIQACETVFLRADGSTIEVELTVQPLEIDGRREGAVVAFRDISERKLLENELKWQANHDPLTKLFNRKYLEDALEREIHRLQRSEETSALLYLDLDRFKYINDTIGHSAGDQLLVELAEELHQRVRHADLLARIGGDEFALLLHNVAPEQVFAAADEYRKLLESFTFRFNGRSYNIHGSIGVALIDRQSESASDVLSAADLACHIAKGKGRNMTHVYDNEDNKHTMDLDLGWTRRLRQALKHNAFELVYQPMVSLESLPLDTAPDDAAAFQIWLMEQAGWIDILYECLLRLRDRQGRLISPHAFLPTAERFNMMADIDRWVLDTAIETLNAAQRQGRHLQLSVNLSGQCLSRTDTMEHMKARLHAMQAPSENLLLEITESCAIRHLQAVEACIDDIRQQLGVRFAIDDFGTGYSTLSQLKHLPVDFIKIDGQFIRDMESDPTDVAIVRSIVQIAHAAGKRTVAEFVESLSVLRLLQSCGVDYAQGFFLSPPRANLPEERPFDDQKAIQLQLPDSLHSLS